MNFILMDVVGGVVVVVGVVILLYACLLMKVVQKIPINITNKSTNTHAARSLSIGPGTVLSFCYLAVLV